MKIKNLGKYVGSFCLATAISLSGCEGTSSDERYIRTPSLEENIQQVRDGTPFPIEGKYNLPVLEVDGKEYIVKRNPEGKRAKVGDRVLPEGVVLPYYLVPYEGTTRLVVEEGRVRAEARELYGLVNVGYQKGRVVLNPKEKPVKTRIIIGRENLETRVVKKGDFTRDIETSFGKNVSTVEIGSNKYFLFKIDPKKENMGVERLPFLLMDPNSQSTVIIRKRNDGNVRAILALQGYQYAPVKIEGFVTPEPPAKETGEKTQQTPAETVEQVNN